MYDSIWKLLSWLDNVWFYNKYLYYWAESSVYFFNILLAMTDAEDFKAIGVFTPCYFSHKMLTFLNFWTKIWMMSHTFSCRLEIPYGYKFRPYTKLDPNIIYQGTSKAASFVTEGEKMWLSSAMVLLRCSLLLGLLANSSDFAWHQA